MSAKKNPIRPFRDSFSRPANYRELNVKYPWQGAPLVAHEFYPADCRKWWDEQDLKERTQKSA